jgi:tetratricopeptide (TPR) repeat protein
MDVRRLAFVAAVLSGFAWHTPVSAQEDEGEAAKQRQIAERFLTVLEKNPRRGTALDRVYGHHIEWGTVDALVKRYEERTGKDPKDASAWMVLGLIESQRGRDAAAVAAFAKAEQLDAKSAIAAYYHGQSLVLVGQPDAAVQAFERAIERKPPRADLLEIFQALGRVHQRAQRAQQALDVWSRLEKLFPDDLRVQEQIATTLLEEGQFAQALPRYEMLAKKTKDAYRQTMFRMEAADMKVRLKQTSAALADLEELMGSLSPDSWLHREARRKIEEVFLKSDDQAGLTKYYTEWVAKHGEDVDAMARLARLLASQGQVAEARTWLEKALKLAPSRKELRLALIEQLAADRQYVEAAAQYEALDKTDPNNPDYLRSWGRLLLADTARPEPERKKAAAAVWTRLSDAKPKDPVVASQVADLLRQAEMSDEALELYRRAVALAPEAPQYREYLGEYYHTLKRNDEALATWRDMVAGPKRTAENLARLAEVLAGFDYRDEALKNIAEACTLDPKNFNLQLQAAEMFGRVEKHDEAFAYLDSAGKLVASEDESESVLRQRLRLLQESDRLGGEIEKLEAALKSDAAAPAERWYLLARYQETQRKFPEATAAIAKAIEKSPKSLSYLAASARIHEGGGDLSAAAEVNRKLAAADRRFRTEYLTAVAKLELQLGRRDAALQAGRDLLAAAPGNPEHYEFYAQLCFQAGRADEGLDALRRSVRLNPTEPKAVLTLAEALANQFRTGEAIELYWRAFEKSGDLDSRLSVISKLSDLYLQTNHFDKLLERLERERREAEQPREATICLAQAYHAAGDYGTARKELEQLFTQDSRDTQLLQQLGKLAESESDYAGAVKYQQQLATLAPSKEADTRLAQLLTQAGDVEQASTVWVKMTADEEPERVIKAVDALLGDERYDTVLEITGRFLRDHSDNWEVLYREGVALAAKRPEEAERRFRAILALARPDDEKSLAGQAAAKQATARAPAAAALRSSNPLQTRMQYIQQIRVASGLESREYYYGYSSGGRKFVWGPADFGQARVAALAWMMNFARKGKTLDKFLEEWKPAPEKTADSARAWTWYWLQQLRQEPKEIYAAALELSRTGDLTGQLVYLMSLPERMVSSSNRSSSGSQDVTPALDPAELDHALLCYETIRKRRPELVRSSAYYDPAANVLPTLLRELKRAKRDEAANTLYTAALGEASERYQLLSLMSLAAERKDHEQALALFDRLRKSSRPKTGSANYEPSLISNTFAQLMDARATAKAHAEILPLFDRYLQASMEDKVSATVRPSSASASRNSYRGYFQLHVGGKSQHVQLDYPPANDYLDQGAITLLREAFELYKRDDLLSDLYPYFAQRIEQAAGGDKTPWRLAIASLAWWNEDRERAITEVTSASEAAPADVGLRFDLVEMHEKAGDMSSALAIVDGFQPVDHNAMRQREQLALRLAVRTGDIPRAREAAERLFGLRLDAETQVSLAGQMRQLAMHELSEAVLSRAQRQAGGRPSALSGLMVQYQAQGKPDLAAQIAHQILRRAPSQNAMSGYRDENDSARQQAMRVLAQSGRLKEMISRAEEQLKNAPSSVAAHQSLAEFYTASGEADKSIAIYEKLAEKRPDDAKLRYQIAQSLSNSGKYAESLPHYKAALLKDPSVMARNFYNVQNAFSNAQKLTEFAELLEGIDLRAMGQYYYISNVISNMMSNSRNQDVALRLFRKAWEAFPESRSEMVGYIYRADAFETPEMYDYLRDAIIPSETQPPKSPWAGFESINSYNGDGTATGPATQLMTISQKQQKLDAIERDLDTAIARYPTWLAGKALKGVVMLRSGRVAEARPLLEELIQTPGRVMPSGTSVLLGQELYGYDELRPLALKVYEDSLNDMQSGNEYSYSPAKRLVSLYQDAGRQADARRVLKQYASKNYDDRYDASYASYRRISQTAGIGTDLIKSGDPLEAARMSLQILRNTEDIAQARNYYGGDVEANVRKSLAEAMKALESPGDTTILDDSLQPGKSKQAGDAAIDLVLVVYPVELDKAELRSLLEPVLRSGSKSDEQRNALRSRVETLTKDHPEDFSVLIARVLAAKAMGDDRGVAEGVAPLVHAMDSTPLETLPAGTKANSRQRAEAARQLGLWLAARECLTRPDLRSQGEKLGRRAIEAAQRQSEPDYQLAMLREWGEIEIKRGDRAAAEKLWTEMLERVLTKPVTKPRKESETSPPRKQTNARPTDAGNMRTVAAPTTDRASAAIVQASATQRSAAPTRSTDAQSAPGQPKVAAKPATALVPPATVPQFQKAIQIAKLAIERQMPALSLRAVREALEGGPPVPVTNNSRSGSVRMVGVATPSPDEKLFQDIEERLLEMDALWSRHHAPAKEVFATLSAVVLPAGRPEEMFLYPRPLANSGVQSPRSVGAILVRRAVESEQVAPLRAAIDARKALPLAALPAQGLTAQLALTAGEFDELKQLCAAFTKRLDTDKLQNSAEIAAHAALPAFERDATRLDALPVLRACIAVYSTQTGQSGEVGGEPASGLMLMLARHHLRGGEIAEARKQLDDYVALGDRIYAQYGSSASYYRRQRLAQVIRELERYATLTDLLPILGQWADLIHPANYWYDQNPLRIDPAAARLAALPAAERYTTLKAWTMPDKERRSIRLMAGFASHQSGVPSYLQPSQVAAALPAASAEEANTSALPSDVISNLTLLVDAARELGKLDELAGETESAVKEKLQYASTLALLVQLARTELPTAEAFEKAFRANDKLFVAPPRNQGGSRELWPSYLVARSAASSPALGSSGRKLLETIASNSRNGRDQITTHARRDVAVGLANSPVIARAGHLDPGLSLWQPVTFAYGYDEGNLTGMPASWIAHEESVTHVAGELQDHLHFDVPLTGTFQFSIDIAGPASASGAGYSGLIFSPPGTLWAMGNQDSASRPYRVRPDGPSRLTIDVRPGRVQCLVDGSVLSDDTDPSPCSPWLVLLSMGYSETSFRNPELRGTPTIPREVPLTHGDRLEGWISRFYQERQPPRYSKRQANRSEESDGRLGGATATDSFDWQAKDGVIEGRRVPNSSEIPVQSRLYYHRPLRSGEWVDYEFFYEPGEVMVHPSIGRLAFLLEPQGVREHWMTRSQKSELAEHPVDNRHDEPANRRGPEQLPLNAGKWNTLSVAIEGETARLTLNGTLVYERPLEPGNDRLFGFFHEKNRTSSQVRNVVLRGEWPDSLSDAQRSNLFETRASGVGITGRNRAAIVGEDVLTKHAAGVLRQARSLPADKQFDRLRDWVLPGDNHAAFRLAGSFTSADESDARPADAEADRGTIEAPALTLVALAKSGQRLDELATMIEAAPAEDNTALRSRLALQILVRVAQERDSDAAALLEQLLPLLKKVTKNTPEHERWPELLAARAAQERPALLASSRALLDCLVLDQLKGEPAEAAATAQDPDDEELEEEQPQPKTRQSVSAAWRQHAIAVRGRALQLAANRDNKDTVVPLEPWKAVMQSSEQLMAATGPAPLWERRGDLVSCFAGFGRGGLFYQSPLTGDFEVSADMVGGGMPLSYGGIWIEVAPDRKSIELWKLGQEKRKIDLNPPLEPAKDVDACRLAVKDRVLTMSINGRQLHEQKLAPHADPWLVLREPTDRPGSVRGLTISGAPAVPEQIELAELPDLSAWRAWHTADALTFGRGQTPSWRKEANEIRARKDESSGTHRPSLLQYHRPLLEDGELDYEFYYSPGKTLVHPAIGEVVLLLSADGTRTFRVSDPAPLSSDAQNANPSGVQRTEKLPLTSEGWNQVQVTLVGDKVSVRLNGEAIGEWEARSNAAVPRNFGLFHFADQTEVRVRGVKYRGRWPAR